MALYSLVKFWLNHFKTSNSLIKLSFARCPGLIVQGNGLPELVAVKIEKAGTNPQRTGEPAPLKALKSRLSTEFSIYEKLGVFDPHSVSKSKECVPKVYHLETDLLIGDIKVNAMFMQLLGVDLLEFLSRRDSQISLRETLMTGLTLVILR